MDKTVLVNYFASFREQRGLASEHYNTQAATLAELYDELKLKHGFQLLHRNLRVAKNTEFCSWDAPLTSGDEIAFIPPVAGG
jgi:molybdopterin converting factor subunit 1